jgi:7-carboxy-7-deazaguanine synthase
MAEYPYQLKFVVACPGDLTEIHKMIEDTGADPRRVLLMPEGTSADVLRERGKWLAELCKQEGFRYSPRLHVDLWGDKRGV